ncbi:MAG: SGNH/GDSL hydrolase family protein [Candidatus Kaiserbacteria bacterium]|nr:SGNH/GDSL hydrolase family protein [Candidatus Kaiserbacteria bacterium]MCB9816448.1 SGNH/GDSL hydrolase family protein [Candidatus Nomurabacteria bacterium]
MIDFFSSLSSLDWFVYVGDTIIVMVVLQALRMIIKLSRNKFLGLTTKPFACAGSGGKRVLILGDSTAVGTGASRPEDTIAGRLATDYPDAEIINVAQNGGLVRDLPKQIEVMLGQQFDLIIVSVGGNDVWHLTSIRKIQQVLQTVLPQLNELCKHRVLFLLYNNIGSAPLFPGIMRGFLKRRCIRVQEAIAETALAYDVPTIELFNEDERNPFIKNPNQLFAFDGVHPSSDGYRLWYHRMWRIMHENGYRFD